MDQNRAPPAFVIPDVSNIDPKKLGSIGGPEYIPYNPRGRDIYGRLSFNTGVCWVGGFAVGGTAGLVEGWRSAVNPNWKVKFNSVLNGLSKQGSRLGNGLGIIAFMHTTSVWLADTLELERLTGTEAATPVFSGLLTGVVYKSTRGPRAMALAGTIGIGVSCTYWYAGSYLYNVVLGRNGKF